MVQRESEAFVCSACARHYPVILDIADFRLTSDGWLSIEDDRQKGLALESQTNGRSLRAMIEAYWAMTPTTTAERAQRFTEHVAAAEARSREWIDLLGPGNLSQTLPSIDLGCGTADLAVVLARHARRTIAIDIAFRWLVVARRRLQEAGVTDRVTLICADAGALPLADGSAGQVFSLGLLEHTPSAEVAIREARRVLAPGGSLDLRTTNRCSMLPEPHVNVWGVGWLPRRWADRYVRWRTGEGYGYVRPVTVHSLDRALRDAGFVGRAVRAAAALPSDLARLGAPDFVARAYNRTARVPVASRVLAWIAPLLEAHGVAP
jgi:SAM-dependent methyltransferase